MPVHDAATGQALFAARTARRLGISSSTGAFRLARAVAMHKTRRDAYLSLE